MRPGYAMAVVVLALLWLAPAPAQAQYLLDTNDLQTYVDQFNANDRWFFGVSTDAEVSQVNNGVYGGQYVKNADAFDYLKDRIPLFDAPDTGFERTYYFRWWTYRKHIKNLGSAGDPNLVLTEFIDPVGWADPTNTINAAAGHHIYEGRWLRDPEVMDDYERYWMKDSRADPRNYSAWLADAMLARYKVSPDDALATELVASTSNLRNLESNWDGWQAGYRGGERKSDGLYYQAAGVDAMENSYGGNGKRPSINSYMQADAHAIAEMLRIAAAHDPANAATYNAKANLFDQEAYAQRHLVMEHLWDPGDEFFKTGYGDFDTDGSLQDRREEIGFIPWMFGLPEDGGAVDYDKAWSHLGSFTTANGLTSGAHDESGYNTGAVGSCCRWDGPIWPFATTQTLKAMARLLQDYEQSYIDKATYMQQLETYTDSHVQQFTQDGDTQTIAWIDESMVSGGGDAGDWTQIGINRDGNSGNDNPRGFAYNHSGYVDLVITGLVGLKPRMDDVVELDPLIPGDEWDYFALDNLEYHDKTLTILWDADGSQYGRGAGFRVFMEGVLLAQRPDLGPLTASMVIAGDLDDDGDVDLADYQVFQANFTGPAGSGKTPDEGDLDGDGDIDLADYGAFQANFTGPGTGGGMVNPEPATLALLGLGGVGLLLGRKRR